MKRILSLAVAASLASSAVLADEKSDPKAFREAYNAYQLAVENGKRADAMAYAREAFEYGEKLFGPDHKNTAALLLNYGRLIYNNEDARDVLADAVKRYEKLYGADSAEMIDPLMDLAANSAGIGTLGKAKRIYSRALKLGRIHYPDNALIEGQIRLEMGKISLQEARARSALKELRRAKDLLRDTDSPIATAKIAEADFYIGKYMMADGKYERAEESLLKSLEVFEQHAPNSSMTLSNHAFLIRVYEEQGLRDQATKHCRAIGAKTPRNPDQEYMPVYLTGPVYPRAAQRAGKEGYAIVEFTVDKDGFVKDPYVVEVDGHKTFGTAAANVVSKFRYAPRYKGGSPVDSTGVRYRFSFNLAN